MTRNTEAATGSSPTVSCQVTPLGRAMLGKPLGTGPSIETPWDSRLNAQLATIAPITATSPPGIALIQRSNTISTASTDADTSAVDHDAWPRWPRVLKNSIRLLLKKGTPEACLGIP